MNDDLALMAEWIADTIRDTQPGVTDPVLGDGWDQVSIERHDNEVHILLNKGTHPSIEEYTIIVRRERK